MARLARSPQHQTQDGVAGADAMWWGRGNMGYTVEPERSVGNRDPKDHQHLSGRTGWVGGQQNSGGWPARLGPPNASAAAGSVEISTVLWISPSCPELAVMGHVPFSF